MTNTNTNNSVEEKLIGVGCYVWEKYGRKRIYINEDQLEKVFGLSISRYNSGWICSAFLNGEKISNSEARRLLAIKPYYDCLSGKFVGKLAPLPFFAA